MSISSITLFVINLLLLSIQNTFSAQSADSSTTEIQTEKPPAVSDTSITALKKATSDTISTLLKERDAESAPASSGVEFDSSSHLHKNEDFVVQDASRLSIFDRNTIVNRNKTPFHYSTEAIYRSDASSPSEMVTDNPFLISIPFGLSNSLNRVLYFGNTAPITKFKQGRTLFSPIRSPFEGTDQLFLSSIASLDLNPGYLSLSTPSGQFSTPEVHILWENGVFKENILNVRFSRPFTKNLTAHIYSNYRYFKEQYFSHAGNDIFNFFDSFQDSTDLSYKGYSPLVDEHVTGAGFDWNRDNQQFSLNVQYGEFNNEIPRDTASKFADTIINAKFFRYPLTIFGNAMLSHSERIFSIIEAQVHTEPLTRIVRSFSSGTIHPLRNDADMASIDGTIKTGLQLTNNDSVGLQYTAFITRQTLYNDSSRDAYQHLPSLFYSRKLQFADLSGNVSIDGGMIFSSFNNSHFKDPRLNLTAQLSSEKRSYRLFVEQDLLPLVRSPDPNPDTLQNFDFLHKRYFRAGCELFFKWNIGTLSLGYQYVSQIDSEDVAFAWPSGVMPYQQPRSTISIAPTFTPAENLTISVNTMVSDRKPLMKASGKLTYTAHPFNTSEFIDISLYANYWSERDPVSFAGKEDWNKPIIHPGLEIAAHIKTFRLFYKVDNLLNRKFAYVPGYYSPGITFRWGFNWFIQR
jgi:hypothetical protein